MAILKRFEAPNNTDIVKGSGSTAPVVDNVSIVGASLIASVPESKVLERAPAQSNALESKAPSIKPNTVLVKVTKAVPSSNGRVSLAIECPYDSKLVDFFRHTPGRTYANGVNYVPLETWADTLERFGKELNTNGVVYQLEVSDDANKSITDWIKSPAGRIELSTDEKSLNLKSIKYDYTKPLFPHIDGMRMLYPSTDQRLPVAEGWRLWEKIKERTDIEWSKEAIELVLKDVENRARVSKVLLESDIKDLPVKLNGHSEQLKPFQRVGIAALKATGFNGVLGDQMGLGKTWQAIASVELLAKELNRDPRVLWVCPANLRTNICREILRLTGKRPNVMQGEMPQKYDFKELVVTREYQWNVINYDIMSTKKKVADKVQVNSRELLANVQDIFPWVELLNIAEFDIVFLDEGHYLKNKGSLRSVASRRLECERFVPITGTPVLNRPDELWPLLALCKPDLFPSYESFISTYTVDGKVAKNVENLRQMLSNVLIRRTKKDVLKDLPPVNRIWEWVEMGDKARRIYQLAMNGVYKAMAEYNPGEAGAEKAITNILVRIMRCKQICAIAKLGRVIELAEELADSYEVDDTVKQLPSGQSVANNNLPTVHQRSGKVLIFTQFKGIVNTLAAKFTNEAVIHTGDLNRSERQQAVDDFISNPKLKYFIATWQTAGEGLNLQCADNVIFADLFWTPANHQQCEERAYGRLADPHPINSYYVVVENSIEEWIQELLEQKLAIIEQTVEGLNTERNQSIQGALLARMRREMGK